MAFSDLNGDGDIQPATEILQVADYYPFGMEHAASPATTQIGPKNQYLYNGKEMQSDFNWGWYDYGARFYNPTLGAWGQVDPLAEKYYPFSGYNYVMNNPSKLIDPDGMRVSMSEKALAGTAGADFVRSDNQEREKRVMSQIICFRKVGV